MKKFTSLVLTFTMLLFCNWADAQNAKPVKPVSKHSLFALLAKEKAAKINSSSRSKKETQKKLATYTNITADDVSGQITDTTEKYVITWGNNGLPTQVVVSGIDEDIIDGQVIPYKVVYTDFVKINPMSGSDFDWFYEDADFDSKSGIAQIYVNNTWRNYIKIDKVISSQGFLDQYIESEWKVNAWVNSYKESIKYDSHGNVTEYLGQVWLGGQWVNESRYTDFYDADGRNAGYMIEVWENNNWVVDYGSKIIYAKNAGNQVISAERQQMDEEGNWVPYMRQEFVWNASNEITEATEQQYMNGEWHNTSQYKNIVWKTFDAMNSYSYPIIIGGQNFQSVDGFNYNGFDSTWQETSRYRNTFTGNNITESNTLYFNGTDWDTTTRTISAYYTNGDLKETQSWYKDNGVWAVQYGYGSNNTYDNDGDITKRISLDWDRDNNIFVENNIELFTYTNVTVGIAKNRINTSTINVFPNPVTAGNITVALANNSSATAYITVYDNVGKVVLQGAENAGKFTLDVNALPKGLYIINVNQAGSISKAQFIIQ